MSVCEEGTHFPGAEAGSTVQQDWGPSTGEAEEEALSIRLVCSPTPKSHHRADRRLAHWARCRLVCRLLPGAASLVFVGKGPALPAARSQAHKVWMRLPQWSRQTHILIYLLSLTPRPPELGGSRCHGLSSLSACAPLGEMEPPRSDCSPILAASEEQRARGEQAPPGGEEQRRIYPTRANTTAHRSQYHPGFL